jgi:hypothetical protein
LRRGEASLSEGNSVLFYSDGLVEAHDPKVEMVGFPRLQELVAEHGKECSVGDSLWRNSTPSLGELAVGGRYHPPYAATFHDPKLSFREHTY